MSRREQEEQLSIYDDFSSDRWSNRPRNVREKKKNTHTLAWGIVCVINLMLILTVVLFLAPQLMGIRFAQLPNYGFAGGRLLEWDEEKADSVTAAQKLTRSDTFYNGITVDGVDISGMTMEQARRAVERTEAQGGGDFGITIRIGGQGWLIDSDMVHMTRNTEEVLAKAWALGRTNTADTAMTPLREKESAIADIAKNGASFTTTLSHDSTVIRQMVDTIAAPFNKEPVSAEVTSFDLQTKKFGFSQDVSGTSLSADQLYFEVMDLIENGSPYGTVSMEPEEVIAPTTKAELMSKFRKISSYTTNTTDNKNRNENVRLSCEAINGVILQAGETFSFNKATGERTAAKGYKEANAISGGQSRPEIGGGVCQTSSTLFNAVARADLQIDTRSPHAWPSSYVKEGMDATVNWPGLDFRFTNNTDWPIYIVAEYKDRKCTVELYGMSLGSGVTIDLENRCIKTMKAPTEVKEVQNTSLKPGTREVTVQARDGSVWETFRVYYRNGKEEKRELLCTSTYKMYQKTVEWN